MSKEKIQHVALDERKPVADYTMTPRLQNIMQNAAAILGDVNRALSASSTS